MNSFWCLFSLAASLPACQLTYFFQIHRRCGERVCFSIKRLSRRLWGIHWLFHMLFWWCLSVQWTQRYTTAVAKCISPVLPFLSPLFSPFIALTYLLYCVHLPSWLSLCATVYFGTQTSWHQPQRRTGHWHWPRQYFERNLLSESLGNKAYIPIH